MDWRILTETVLSLLVEVSEVGYRIPLAGPEEMCEGGRRVIGFMKHHAMEYGCIPQKAKNTHSRTMLLGLFPMSLNLKADFPRRRELLLVVCVSNQNHGGRPTETGFSLVFELIFQELRQVASDGDPAWHLLGPGS